MIYPRNPQKSGHGEKLSRKQEAAIASLCSHSTIVAAAEAVGVCEKTLKRWLHIPEFAARYKDAQRQVLDAAVASLKQGCVEAASVLRSVLCDPSAGGSVKVSAARTILEQTIRCSEILELEERIARLEGRSERL